MVKADCSVHVIVDKTLTALTQKNQKIIASVEHNKIEPKDLMDNFSFCGIYESG